MGVSYDTDLRQKAKAENKKLVTVAAGGTVWQEAVDDATYRKIMRFALDITEPGEVKAKPSATPLFDEGPESDE